MAGEKRRKRKRKDKPDNPAQSKRCMEAAKALGRTADGGGNRPGQRSCEGRLSSKRSIQYEQGGCQRCTFIFFQGLAHGCRADVATRCGARRRTGATAYWRYANNRLNSQAKIVSL